MRCQQKPGVLHCPSSSIEQLNNCFVQGPANVVLCRSIQCPCRKMVVRTTACYPSLVSQARRKWYIYTTDGKQFFATSLTNDYPLTGHIRFNLTYCVMFEDDTLYIDKMPLLFYLLALPWKPEMPYMDSITISREADDILWMFRDLKDTEACDEFREDQKIFDKLCDEYEVLRVKRELRMHGYKHMALLNKSFECLEAAKKMRSHALETSFRLRHQAKPRVDEAWQATSSSSAQPSHVWSLNIAASVSVYCTNPPHANAQNVAADGQSGLTEVFDDI